MTKLEVQKRVLKNGKPLDLELFTWDEKTKTFSSTENGLVLDFRYINNVTFKTGYNCTFSTGDSCTFKTGSYCTFSTGYDCTLDCYYKAYIENKNNDNVVVIRFDGQKKSMI